MFRSEFDVLFSSYSDVHRLVISSSSSIDLPVYFAFSAKSYHSSPLLSSQFSYYFKLQLLSAVNCWLKCMVLDPYTQSDHPECKSRPDIGLSAITELDPGYITGTKYI